MKKDKMHKTVDKMLKVRELTALMSALALTRDDALPVDHVMQDTGFRKGVFKKEMRRLSEMGITNSAFQIVDMDGFKRRVAGCLEILLAP